MQGERQNSAMASGKRASAYLSARVYTRAVALLILALYLVLGIVYSVVNPLFESPDELTHYPYIQHLASGGGLPVQHSEQPDLWEQEGSQPPLYYALAAALTCWIDTSDLPTIRAVNPHACIGLPLATDNKNAALHNPGERFPWRGTALAVHLVRLFSLLLGAGTVWCTYRLGRTLLPGRPALALGAMALNAFLPMFLFISASVNNDNLVTLLASLTLLLLVHIARDESPRYALVGLGLLTGLAALSKLSGLGLLALAPAALALRERRLWRDRTQAPRPPHAAWRALGRVVRDCAVVYALAALVAGWWYARNVHLYSDLLGTAPMIQIMGRREALPTWSELVGEFRGLRMSFWGLFGWFNVLLQPAWLYRVFDALTLIALAGLGVGVWRARRRLGQYPWEALVLLALWIAVESAALVRWTLMTMASQGRLLFPAITAVCLFLSLGIVSWFPRRTGRIVLAGVSALLFVLAAATPFWSILPAYAAPRVLSASDLPAQARPYNVTYGDKMRLLAYEVEPVGVRPGEMLTVRLYWQALAPMDRNYSIYVHLFGWHNQPLGQRDTYPGGGAYATSQWSPGEIVCDSLQVRVREDAEGPVALRVVAGLYDRETMANLPAVDERGSPVGEPLLTRVKLIAPTRARSAAHPLDINLGNRVRLTGYDIGANPLTPGHDLQLALYWQVLGPLGRDYTVFVHLVDEAGNMVSQGDGPPMGRDYPTSYWGAGEDLVDERSVPLPHTLAAGDYQLYVGLYDPITGARLPILASDGTTSGDAILLGSVSIAGE